MKKSLNKESGWMESYLALWTVKTSFTLLFIGIMCCLPMSNLYSQNSRISIKCDECTLKEVLSSIEKKTGYSIAFPKDLIDNKTVSIDVEDEDVEKILNQILEPRNLSYHISGKQIVIAKKTDAVQATTAMRGANSEFSLNGTVVDSKSAPFPGVIVHIKGTQSAVSTDADGNFSIKVIPGYTLEFKMVGFKTVEVLVQDQKNLEITLEENLTELEDVVVVGWGTQKKESVVGAIQSVSSKELRVPSSSLSNALGGRLSGVIAVQRTGEPGADASSFWIRGISTFTATSPLIFIDGIESSVGDMNALPAEAIEGFSVLKDAAATALYGARGANGVMLITTRTGTNMERAKINFRLTQSFAGPTKTVGIADGPVYMRMYNEALSNTGQNPIFSEEKITNTINGADKYLYPNVDWMDYMFKDFSLNQSANINITGGSNKMDYFASATVTNDNGMLKSNEINSYKNNIKNMVYSFQVNVNANITRTTKVGVKVNSQIYDYEGPATDVSTLYSQIFKSPGVFFQPVLPAQKGEDHILFGNETGGPNPPNNTYDNPYASMVSGHTSRNRSTVNSSFHIEQDLAFITKGLNIKGIVSFKNYSYTQTKKSFDPYYYRITDTATLPNNQYGFDYVLQQSGRSSLESTSATSGDRYMNLQAILNYQRRFGVHDVSGMLVYLQRDYRLNNPKSGVLIQTLPERNQGLAGRMTYSYDNRYLAEFNFGYNGSENFESGSRYGFFPSIALGYVVSNEKFFEPLTDVVSNLKLRGSYGLVGNSYTPTRFPYLTELAYYPAEGVEYNKWAFSFGKEASQIYKQSFLIKKYGAQNASWEISTKLNLGIDLGFLKNSLMLNVDYFYEDRKDIFVQRRTLPIEIGIGDANPYANLGRVTNEGIDIVLDYHKQLSKDLFISAKGTFTYAHNVVKERDEPTPAFEYMSQIGRPLHLSYGYVALGLFEDEEDVKSSPRQTFNTVEPKPGDIKYKDLNGDGEINAYDQTYFGKPTYAPEIIYGLGFSAEYKKWDFSLLFQGVARTSIQMSGIHPFGGQKNVVMQYVADNYWSESNPNPYATYPRLDQTVNNNNSAVSTYWERDGSFLRLKNMEIGYSFSKFRVYLAGQNLLTFSKFKYWDPELGSGSGLKYPVQTVGAIGLQLTL